MNTIKRRDFLKVSLAMVGGPALAAHAGTTSAAAAAGTSLVPKAAPSTATGAPATVRFSALRLSEPIPSQMIKKQIARFMELHPNIKIVAEAIPTSQPEKLVAEMASGDGPDVAEMGTDTIPNLVKLDYLLDHTKLIESEGPKFTEIYEKKFFDMVRSSDGKPRGLPVWTNTLGLAYNAGWFGEVGLNPNQPPRTWTDYVSYAKKLTRDKGGTGRVNQWGIGLYGMRQEVAARYLHLFYWSNGAAIYNDDMTKATINSEKGVEAFTWYTNLYFQGLVGPTFMTNAMQDIYKDWVNEKVNMIMVGPWLRFFVRATVPAMEKNLRSAPTPYHEHPGPAGTTATAGYGLTTQVRNQDAAWEFVKFMCTRDNLVEYCLASDYIPPVTGAAKMPQYKDDKWMQYFLQALPTARLVPVHPRKGDLDLVIADALQAVWLRRKTAKQAVDDAEIQLNKILSEKA